MKQLKAALKKHTNLKKIPDYQRFFKTGKGQYGEGDIFLGISVPVQRMIAKETEKRFSLDQTIKLLQSPIHEERLISLLILVEKYKKAKNKKQIFNLYLKNAKRVNNWDLVDLSAPNIIGNYILENQDQINVLYKLSKSKNLWEKRISILGTFPFIREGYVDECLKISKLHLEDKHDLIHKAIGWMLREAWKKKPKKVEDFIIGNYKSLPRTTLRYAIERMPEDKRRGFLKGEFNLRPNNL
ncbi:MAG: DNA alkylation repair protein [archaeon]|nr:DNA alkylation repair protein [archaeon]MCR4323366.1 DNA alkylation repair protein [Nanoarchaeota archaeon]